MAVTVHPVTAAVTAMVVTVAVTIIVAVSVGVAMPRRVAAIRHCATLPEAGRGVEPRAQLYAA
jgi:hypothetical protein